MLTKNKMTKHWTLHFYRHEKSQHPAVSDCGAEDESCWERASWELWMSDAGKKLTMRKLWNRQKGACHIFHLFYIKLYLTVYIIYKGRVSVITLNCCALGDIASCISLLIYFMWMKRPVYDGNENRFLHIFSSLPAMTAVAILALLNKIKWLQVLLLCVAG